MFRSKITTVQNTHCVLYFRLFQHATTATIGGNVTISISLPNSMQPHPVWGLWSLIINHGFIGLPSWTAARLQIVGQVRDALVNIGYEGVYYGYGDGRRRSQRIQRVCVFVYIEADQGMVALRGTSGVCTAGRKRWKN